MKTKICNLCNEPKLLIGFYKDSHMRDGRRNACKFCTSAAKKIKYNTDEKYRSRMQATTRVYQKALRKKFQIKILKLLVKSGCVDCGEKDPIVLEFDHVKGKKISGVGEMVRTKTNWKIIKSEIDKCLVRCANCHRRKTAKTHNWYADIDLSTL